MSRDNRSRGLGDRSLNVGKGDFRGANVHVGDKLESRPSFSHTNIYGDSKVGDKYSAGQVGAQGPGAHAHDMTFNQIWSQLKQSIDLQTLATELTTLRQHLRQEAVEPEDDMAIGAVANAEVAAKEGDGPKVLEWLGKAGKWTLENAEKIGVGVAIAALKTALGV